jgi:phage host-nuclease inhibitor protein Gam
MTPLPPELALETEPDIPVCASCGGPGAYLINTAGQVVCEACEAGAAETDAERWQITDNLSAEWAMRKVAEAERARDRTHEQAFAWREQIDRWEAEQLKPLNRTVSFFTGHLAQFLQELRSADPDTKSLSLPSGRVSSKRGQAKVRVIDEAQVIAFLQKYAEEMDRPAEDFLRAKVEVKTLALRELLSEDGLEAGLAVLDSDDYVVPGVEVTPPAVTFTVKPRAI